MSTDGPMYELIEMTSATRNARVPNAAHTVDGNDTHRASGATVHLLADDDGIRDGDDVENDDYGINIENHAEEIDAHGPVRGSRSPAFSCLAKTACVSLTSIAVAVGVFALLFVVVAQPQVQIADRMMPTECTIATHVLIMRESNDDDGGDNARHMPGLGVRFLVTERSGPLLFKTGIAKPRVRNDDAWMRADERDAYFALYPVNSIARCYYDREQLGLVAMHDENDAVTDAITWCMALAAGSSLIVFCLLGACVYGGCGRLVRRRPLQTF